MTQRTTIEMTMAYHLVSQILGDVKETFDNPDEEKNGRTRSKTYATYSVQLGHKNPSEEEIKEAMKDLDDDNSGDVDYEEFKTWYTTSESRFVANKYNEFDNVDEDNSGGIDKMELKGLLSKLGHEFSENEVESTFKELDTDGDGVIDRDEFALWYRGRDRPYEKQMQVAQEAQDQDEESIAVPDTVGGKIIHVLTLPLVVLFVFTVPDVEKTGKLGGCKISDWFSFSFIMSIVWIGICSYFMVWMVVTIGKTLGIDDKIRMTDPSAAGGCHVPDLPYQCACCDERRRRHGRIEFHWKQYIRRHRRPSTPLPAHTSRRPELPRRIRRRRYKHHHPRHHAHRCHHRHRRFRLEDEQESRRHHVFHVHHFRPLRSY